MSTPVVVLLSGGMDSALLASYAPPGSVALFIDWGQPSVNEERAHARGIAERFELKFRRMSAHISGVPMRAGCGVKGARVVPGRNLLFIALAVTAASELDIKRIWIGASLADQEEYPDCRMGFMDKADLLCSAAYGVSVQAPLHGMTRETIRRRVQELELETWSCYEPKATGIPCGTCNACMRAAG